MKAYMLRRRKLGRTSVKEIRKFSQNIGKRILGKDMKDPALVCIRWGYTQAVPQKNVFNTAEAIHEVNNKKTFRIKLAEAGLAPKTWGTYKEWVEFFRRDEDKPMIPVVLRPAVHAQGKHTYLLSDKDDLYATSKQFKDYYISEFINKTEEYRVFVAQGRAVWVAKKTPGNPQDVAWNVARGGRFDNVRFQDWPLKVIKTAIAAFNMSTLDFGGVDVMSDVKGNAYVLEINSAPSQTSPYRQESCAKAFDYMLIHGKDRLPLKQEKGGYLKFIHPAIDNNANV
jgi:glutathione synthase/RimK-type ligase-like ATP-grasp enzyme